MPIHYVCELCRPDLHEIARRRILERGFRKYLSKKHGDAQEDGPSQFHQVTEPMHITDNGPSGLASPYYTSTSSGDLLGNPTMQQQQQQQQQQQMQAAQGGPANILGQPPLAELMDPQIVPADMLGQIQLKARHEPGFTWDQLKQRHS